jgi:uncharacterized Zn finger protein
VAAVLYGVGARLDDDSSLFFVLRGQKMQELISEAIALKSHDLLQKSTAKTGRMMTGIDIAAVFGIDMAMADQTTPPQKSRPEPKGSKRKPK